MSVESTNDIGLVTSSSDPAQPSICEFGEPGPGGNELYSAPIDVIRNQMDGQNDESDGVDDGGRVADVEAKGGGDVRRREHGQQIERFEYCSRSDSSDGSFVNVEIFTHPSLG